MAGYGTGYYGIANYGYGISLGEAVITSASTASITAAKTANASLAVTSYSSISFDGLRIAIASGTVASDTEMTVGSRVVVNNPVVLTGEGNLYAAAVRVAIGAISANATSSASVYGRLKWEPIADTSETWTPLPNR